MVENKRNNFGFLHLIGAVLVMCGHQFDLLQRDGPMVCGFYLSTMGVNILFLISGYLVTKSYFRRNNFLVFLKRRAIRIFPLLIVTTGILAFIVGPIVSELSVHDYFRRTDSYYFFISNILFRPVFHLPEVFHTKFAGAIVNIPIWTLPIEVVGYIMIALVGAVVNRGDKQKRYKMHFAIIFLILVILYQIFEYVKGCELVFWGTNWINGIRLLCYFAFGCMVAYYSLEKYCNMQIAP